MNEPRLIDPNTGKLFEMSASKANFPPKLSVPDGTAISPGGCIPAYPYGNNKTYRVEPKVLG